MDCTTFIDDEFQWKWKLDYIPLWDSTLLCLHDLLVFGTTGEVAHCTKFLINRMHNKSIGLYQAYPIHVWDIHILIGLSMQGQDVTEGFQILGKHGKKKGELRLYEKYGTCRGGRGVHIGLINDDQVHMYCYMIRGKVMHKYLKGECTLDAIAVVEFNKNGAPMN
jgi:hypothetical protein